MKIKQIFLMLSIVVLSMTMPGLIKTASSSCLQSCQAACAPSDTICQSSCSSLPSCPASSSSSQDKDIVQQRSQADQETRQVFRNISSQISNRISSNINPIVATASNDIPKGASADGGSMMPDSLWSNFAWSRLSSNGNSNGVYNANIYQTVTGVDKSFGNLYVGATLNYAGTTASLQSANMYAANHTVGVTPYAAYVFNKNFFISGLTGYNYSTTNYRGVAPDNVMDAYTTELDLNGMHVIGNWFMKGKTGARYLHTYSTSGSFAGLPGGHSNLDSWTYLIDVEGGYAFQNGLRAYSGILYENVSPSTTKFSGLSYNIGNNIFYYSAGADYAVNKKLTLGAKVQTDLNNSYSNLTTIGVNARLLF